MIDKKKVIIYGSGGLGRGIIDLINSINNVEYKWNLLGFVDENNNGEVNGYNILGNIEYLLNYAEHINVVLAFGNPLVKKEIYEKLKENKLLHFPNIIHPSVEISKYNTLGIGNIISKGVSLSTNIQINNFNLIHYNCSIGHDVKIGNFNSVFPLVSISGYVELGNLVEVGTTAAIIPSMKIEDNVVIGAGSVVIDNVSKSKTIVGVPGSEIKN